MRGAALLLALGASACAEPVVELSFKVPTAARGGDFNMQCLTAVDIFTNGNDYPSSPDFVRSCIELPQGPATLSGIKATLAGKIDVRIPESGLASVEIMGRRGTCAQDESIPPGDLLFYAGSAHIGDDQLELPIEASASCDQAPTIVRPVDIIKLTTGATKGDCAAAKGTDGAFSGADVGTLMPSVASGMMFHYGIGAGLTNSIATIPGASTTIGPKACLAVGASDDNFGSVSCVDRSAPTVCAMAGELEAPGINGDLALASIDQAKKTKFPGVIFGAVMNGTRQPIQGATLEIDPKLGEVVYVELAGNKLAPAGTATGMSGLFIVYTSSIASVKVTSGALNRTVQMGAISDAPGGALVVLR